MELPGSPHFELDRSRPTVFSARMIGVAVNAQSKLLAVQTGTPVAPLEPLKVQCPPHFPAFRGSFSSLVMDCPLQDLRFWPCRDVPIHGGGAALAINANVWRLWPRGHGQRPTLSVDLALQRYREGLSRPGRTRCMPAMRATEAATSVALSFLRSLFLLWE